MQLQKELGSYGRYIIHERLSFRTRGASAPDRIRDGKSGLVQSVTRESAGLFTVQMRTDRPKPPRHITVHASISGIDSPTKVCDVQYVEGSWDPDEGTFQVLVTKREGTFTDGEAATGTITLDDKANLGNADTVTIGDGLTPAKVYELDKAGDGVAGSNIQVDVSTDTTDADIAARLAPIIEANQPALDVTDNEDGTLTVTHKWLGEGGNVSMSKSSSSALAVTGLSGGTEAFGDGSPAADDPDDGARISVTLTGSVSTVGQDAA